MGKVKSVFILIALFLSFYSCSRYKVSDIKEIYYRRLSFGASYTENEYGKQPNKTSVIFLFENDSGLVFEDTRGISEINEIIKEKIEFIESNIKILASSKDAFPVRMKKVDSNNFILTIDNSTSKFNIIYKCNLTNDNKVKGKLFIMDGEDTVHVIESTTAGDTTGIYFFQQAKINNPELKLNFQKFNGKNMRDITTETPSVKKNGATYEEEIANFVKVRKLKINPSSIIEKYKNNKLAIELNLHGPTGSGSEVHVEITILDKIIYETYRARGSVNIFYSNQRILSEKELTRLRKIIEFSNVSSSDSRIPVAEKEYSSMSKDLFVKYNNNTVMGGMLYPLELTRSLRTNYPYSKSIYDCVKYSSTLNGNYDTLIKVIQKNFEKYDSLTNVVYGIK